MSRVSTRIYAFALRAFPRAHRAQYGAEMVDAFARALEERRQRGARAAARFAIAAVVDAVVAGFGERHRRRAARHAPRPRIIVSWLDVKLGLRMLVRFPGLSIAGGLALTIAMGIGAAWYDLARDQLHPVLPVPGGDRLVQIALHDSATSRGEWRTLHDYLSWRDLRSVEQLGAWRSFERNLIAGTARQENVRVAAVTASTFTILRVAPSMGRALLESDERPGAPAVIVLGHGVWRQTFGGDPGVIGRSVELGRTAATVVGVMPEGFAFPVSHELWTPLPLSPSGYAPLEGPGVQLFGRLADGATIDQVHTEVAGLVARTASASPGTHGRLRAHVSPYGADEIRSGSSLDLALTHLPVLLVLVVACANVGTLLYARTATREAEIAMRTAIGASRARIVGQLFVEALVFALVAAGAGLVLADTAVRRAFAYIVSQGNPVPFWIRPGLDPTMVLYVVALAVVAAAMLAVIPALKATGSSMQSQLRNLGAGGSTLRFGRGWTLVMIGQVALIVICLPPAEQIAREALRDRMVRARALPDEYLAVRIELDRDDAAGQGDTGPVASTALRDRLYRDLERRLLAEPGVRAVTFGDALPGMASGIRRAELESPGADPIRVRTIWTVAVGDGYFEAFDKAIRAGRDFQSGDRAGAATAILVNEAFARRLGESPIGRRLRFGGDEDAPSREPWLEIVGVVEDLGMTPTNRGEAPHVYRPVSPAMASPLLMGVRAAGDPRPLVPRVRAIAAEVDAGLRLELVQPLHDVAWEQDAIMLGASAGVAAVVGLGLFLAAAGVFSLMSVSVSRRTREIGLRAALGASRGRLLAGVLAHACVLIGSGLAVGNAVVILSGLEEVGDSLLLTSAVMLTVGLLACIQPARRAMRVDPADTLRQA